MRTNLRHCPSQPRTMKRCFFRWLGVFFACHSGSARDHRFRPPVPRHAHHRAADE